jgi:hypothetical protein
MNFFKDHIGKKCSTTKNNFNLQLLCQYLKKKLNADFTMYFLENLIFIFGKVIKATQKLIQKFDLL